MGHQLFEGHLVAPSGSHHQLLVGISGTGLGSRRIFSFDSTLRG